MHSSFDAEGNLLPEPEIQESPFCPSPTILNAPSLVVDDEVIDVDADDDGCNFDGNGNEDPESEL